MQSRTKQFWPSARQFAEAVQCPAICFGDPTLKAMLPAVDRLGMPLVTSGQFAYVFKLNSRDGGESLAVRCFRGFLGDRGERYRALDAHLNARRVAALPRFKYFPRGVLAAGGRYPILVMEWVAGPTLDVYLEEAVGRREVLLHLADEWLRLMETLRAAEVSHGDLQHGNVIVERGQLRLVDLDGAYVPALAGLQSSEVGHQHYQHPARDARFFSPEVDNFSALVIYLSLIALAERPTLWAEHHDENLLFTRADFVEPDASALFAKMREMGGEHARLACVLADAAKADPAATPWLLDLVSVHSRLPSWMTAPAEIDVGERTREVARAEVVPETDAPAEGERLWRQKNERRPPSTLSSNTVQTLFGAPPVAANAPAPLNPSDIRGNTLQYATRLAGNTYAYFWFIPVHNVIFEDVWLAYGVRSETASMFCTLLFLLAAFVLYGLCRALYEAEKADGGQPQTLGGAPTFQQGPPTPHTLPGVAGTQTTLFAGGNGAAAAAKRKVVGNRSLSIYHLPGCVWVDRIAPRNRAEFDSPAAARNTGFRPCRVCSP